MGYGLERWGSIPGRSKIFLSFRQCPNTFRGPPKGYLGSVLGGKAAGVEKLASHLEVKNAKAIPPLAIYCEVYTHC
jgi:hypothetical protein